MTIWVRLAEVLEILGGSRSAPESWWSGRAKPIAWGIWWLSLFLLAAAFAGRNTKFVYVDF